jgi:hypothetical protein
VAGGWTHPKLARLRGVSIALAARLAFTGNSIARVAVPASEAYPRYEGHNERDDTRGDATRSRADALRDRVDAVKAIRQADDTGRAFGDYRPRHQRLKSQRWLDVAPRRSEAHQTCPSRGEDLTNAPSSTESTWASNDPFC